MTTSVKTTTFSRSESRLSPIFTVFLIGATLLFTAGYAQATMLHDAAHDTRHAMAFPCH